MFELEEAVTRFGILVARQNEFFLLFMPHIDILVAGRLRCHPEKEIFEQIQEVFEAILRNPAMLIFDLVPGLTQGPRAKPGGPSLLR